MLDLKQLLLKTDDCGCGCGCHHEPVHTHSDDCGCDHSSDEAFVTMVDEETGEEFSFAIVDDFEYNGQVYCVLLTTDEEPEALFVRVVEDEEGEHFMSLEEKEYEEVFKFYDSLLAEDEAQEQDEEL